MGDTATNPDSVPPAAAMSPRANVVDGFDSVIVKVETDAGITGWHGSLLLGLIRYPTPGSFNVEWCISGLDRHRTYAPDCLMARP